MPHGIYTGLLTLCWGGLGLLWIVGWIYNLWKAPGVQKRSTSLPIWILSIALVWGALLFLRQTIVAFLTFLTFLTFTVPWLQVVGAILLISATAFTLWARIVLGTMWAAVAEIKEDHQLRTTGPYRITRHPIYTGLIGMLLGSMLMGGFGVSVLYFIAGLIALLIKMRSEEHMLKGTFGEQYVHYQQSVPQLIPGTQFLIKRH